MLIATSLSAAALLAAPAPSAATTLPPTPPTLTVAVNVASTLPPALVTYLLAEAADIWRAAGFILIFEQQSPKRDASDWQLERESQAEADAGRAPVGGRLRPSSVRGTGLCGLSITIGNEHGMAQKDPYVLPLGWIVFEAGSPLQEIYLSHANAMALLNSSDFVLGRVATMTNKERYTLLGRALGRALAHEVGHYLLASKAHTATGIMQARRGAAELFSLSRRGFQVEASQRQQIAARLNALAPVAYAGPPAT